MLRLYNVEILSLFDPELQPINTKPVIKNKLKELLSELKKFRVQTILVLDYKKRKWKSKTRVTSSNPRVAISNVWVTSSN